MLLLTYIFISIGLVTAQNQRVTGVVTEENGSPIIGASILVKGTTVGTITDADGKFVLSSVPGSAKMLQVSYIGMHTQEVAIKPSMKVVLKSDEKVLDQVIVVAYGTAKKSSFTGAASVVTSDKIANRPVANVSNVLEGSAPGVSVNMASGQPGSGVDIRVRGFGSINASNDPLYILDGVPFNGAISSINPDDIESISILKDASSTSLYGSRAANGLVMITTKKGKKDATSVQFRASTGFINRALPEMNRVGAKDFMVLSWETMRNGYMFPASGTAMTAAAAGQEATNRFIGEQLYMNPYNVANDKVVLSDGTFNSAAKLMWADDLDWFGAIERTGVRQDYGTSISGGNDKTTYYMSLGYLNEKGFVMKSDFDRWSARANVETKVTSYLRTGINLSGSRSKSNTANTVDNSTGYVNPFYFARYIGPIYPIHKHDATTGAYIKDEEGNLIYDYTSTRPSGASSGRHIVAETEWNDLEYTRTTLGGRAFAEISFLNGFKFTLNAATDYYDNKAEEFSNNKVGDGAPAGRGQRTYTANQTWNLNQILSYEKTFNNAHHIAAKAIHENNSYEYKYLYAFRQGLIAPGNYELINFTTTNDLTSYKDVLTRESYLGNVEYSYNDKYYLSANINYSGSSKFHKDKRWGTFWGLGASWRIDQEDFMKEYSFVNTLKLRSSYGEIGNDNGIGYYAYQALYNLGVNNASEPGYWQSSLASHDLTWESNKQFDIAVDYELFNRVRGSLEFYHRVSDNLLFQEPLPLSSGTQNVWKNIGTMYNRGFEIAVSVDVLKSKDLFWTVDFVGSTNKNKITKMPLGVDGKPKEMINGTKKLSEGHSMYEYWLRQWYGVNPENGEALYYADNTDGTNSFVIGKDTVTSNINNARYGYSGKSTPDFEGSVTNNFRYKNWDLSFMFSYGLGGKVYDGNYASLMSCANYGGAKHVDLMRRWQKAGDITDVPRMDPSRTNDFCGTSSRWLTSRDYLNFRTLTLGYTFPKAWMHAIEGQNARIYVSGENLMYFSARKGMNVLESFSGTTSNVYNPARVITVGFNVTF